MNSPKQPIRIVDRATTLQLMDFPGLISSAERAFVAQSNGQASPPQYINMPVGDQHFAHWKAGYIRGGQVFSVKYSGGFWANPDKGLPVDFGYVIVHDAETGRPEVMFLDQGAITDYRTAAAGAVASKYLSRENSKTVGVIGTGMQAFMQVEALLHVRPAIKQVKVWGRNRDHVQIYIDRVKNKLPKMAVTAAEHPSQAIADSDIVITATASRQPIVMPEWIVPGMHITAVGACTPYMQEHDPRVLAKVNRIFADSIEKCLQDGELHHAVDDNVISQDQITGELGSVISGNLPGRTSETDITFVDLVGLGVQDTTAAEMLMNKLLGMK